MTSINVSQQAVNRFLSESQAQDRKEGQSKFDLTVIHSLDADYSGYTEQLRGDGILRSPFSGKSYEEVAAMLMTLREKRDSKLSEEWFLVMDEKSEQSSSVVIVCCGFSPPQTVRVDWTVASRYISAAEIAHPDIGEMIELAENNTDGILRD